LARAATVWPSVGVDGGCVRSRLRISISLPTPSLSSSKVAAPPTIRTTVGELRRAAAEEAASTPTIKTTVGESRRRATASSASQTRSPGAFMCSEPAADACRSMTDRGSASVEISKPSSESLALVPVPAKGSHEEGQEASTRAYIARTALETFAPLFIAAPLQLLSPWSGLAGAGVALAAGPTVGVPPAFQRNALGIPGMPKEAQEEQFMELIFPGFDSGAFVWQVTMWQITEFVISMFLGHNRANPTPCVLYRLGASWGPAIASGQVWRLITPVFLHANLTHLLFNVFFQLRMGFGMERQFGREKMMLIYFVCGVFGNLMSITIDPYKLAVGASTAGFGLIGVWLAEILLSWEILGPARERTIIWIVFMLISVTTMSSMTPNMDLYGHLGGALGGFLLSIIISDMREQDRPEWYPQVRTAAAIGLAVLMSGSLGKAFLFGARGPLPDCPLLPGLENILPGHAASAATALAGPGASAAASAASAMAGAARNIAAAASTQ